MSITTSLPKSWRNSMASLRDLADGLRIFAVHVEDRDFEHAHDVGRVARRAGVVRHRGEADLVVDDDVDGAAGRVALEPRQVQRLGDDALSDERRVAVDEQRHDAACALRSPRRSCLARTRPSTTGFTHSRWLGLNASERWTLCAGERRDSRSNSRGGTSRRRCRGTSRDRRLRTRRRSRGCSC